MKFIFFLILAILLSYNLFAQIADTIKNERFSIHTQFTVINQNKTAFKAKYSGSNSLATNAESQTSLTSTLFLGARLWKGAGVFMNPEIAGGAGLSGTLGVAAAPNGETYRIGNPAPQIYMARIYFTQNFALNDDGKFQKSDLNQFAGKLPTSYLSATIGKISISDFFDRNKFSHDPRTQFISWGLMSNGAWDYPANTRGYTPTIVMEFITPVNEVRYAYSLVPTIANGSTMEWNISKAGSQTLEFTHRYIFSEKEGTVRLLGFYTKAHMGNYQKSLALKPVNPVIQESELNGTVKYGFGLNVEQNITNELGCFLRAGWNDGNSETWAFTEIDQSVSGGFRLTGAGWNRKDDHLGLALVVSGISKSHQEYLKAGGKGFILGDGNLNYSPEKLTELYYSFELAPAIFLTGTYQILINPGYNKDRSGPVNIFSLRMHVEI